jgi:DNA-3-methyladenine glycosylase
MNEELKLKLPGAFYLDNVTAVAQNLLGKIFVRKTNGTALAGRIVETEAYDGVNDEASHSFNGMTERNRVMFLEGGYLYVYFTYGVHFCCNVVTGPAGYGAAVLLRGIEPVNGIETMALNRFGKTGLNRREFTNLTSGPGKICKAFNIDRKQNGMKLDGNIVYITEGAPVSGEDIIVSKRIGIKKAAGYPWRFYLKSDFVSKK